MKSFKSFLAFFLLFVPLCSADTKPLQPATVEEVITGDSVSLKGGKTLRYLGIRSYDPESKIPLEREYGIRAQAFNDSLVGGKKILLEWGKRVRDKQGRLLAYVHTEDGRFVNEELLREGHAKARIVAPDTTYAERFRDLEYEARKVRKGLWEKEPEDPNRLKRYIGEKNTKIYYFPDSAELERIPEAHLEYFDSRVDAKAAGYRACFDCRESSAEEDGESE